MEPTLKDNVLNLAARIKRGDYDVRTTNAQGKATTRPDPETLRLELEAILRNGDAPIDEQVLNLAAQVASGQFVRHGPDDHGVASTDRAPVDERTLRDQCMRLYRGARFEPVPGMRLVLVTDAVAAELEAGKDSLVETAQPRRRRGP